MTEEEIQEEPFDERSWFQVNLEAIVFPAVPGVMETDEQEGSDPIPATASWEIIDCQFLSMAGSEDGRGMVQEVTRKGDRRYTVFVLTVDAEEAMRTTVSLVGSPLDASEVEA